jgi:hypothetical protein
MFRRAAASADELDETMRYAEIATEERDLAAALTDLERAEAAVDKLAQAIGMVMAVRYQPLGRHRALAPSPDLEAE